MLKQLGVFMTLGRHELWLAAGGLTPAMRSVPAGRPVGWNFFEKRAKVIFGLRDANPVSFRSASCKFEILTGFLARLFLRRRDPFPNASDEANGVENSTIGAFAAPFRESFRSRFSMAVRRFFPSFGAPFPRSA